VKQELLEQGKKEAQKAVLDHVDAQVLMFHHLED
jgi:hypothetical protein